MLAENLVGLDSFCWPCSASLDSSYHEVGSVLAPLLLKDLCVSFWIDLLWSIAPGETRLATCYDRYESTKLPSLPPLAPSMECHPCSPEVNMYLGYMIALLYDWHPTASLPSFQCEPGMLTANRSYLTMCSTITVLLWQN